MTFALNYKKFLYISNPLEKGKPSERMGRKGTGLRPLNGYGSGSAGRIQHLLGLYRFGEQTKEVLYDVFSLSFFPSLSQDSFLLDFFPHSYLRSHSHH
jgi:hypothetical protein